MGLWQRCNLQQNGSILAAVKKCRAASRLNDNTSPFRHSDAITKGSLSLFCYQSAPSFTGAEL
jgi:hypothetical protein